MEIVAYADSCCGECSHGVDPFFLMPGPREGCAKNRRREANYISMFALGIRAVNRNECEDRKFFREFNRISRCVVSHKRYSGTGGHIGGFPYRPSRENGGSTW